MWDVSARHNDKPSSENLTTFTGGKLLQTGPVVVLYKDNIMFRTELKFPVYEDTDGVSNSRGPEISVGIGMTF